MNLQLLKAGAVLMSGVAILRAQGPAGSVAPSGMDEVVREYIMQHPEVLLQSLRLYQLKQQDEKKQKAIESVESRRRELTGDPDSPATRATGEVTIVEFFDYQCGYCKKVRGTLDQLTVANPKVRIVYKDYPILGPASTLAAKAALAANRQNAYLKFHQALMESGQPVTPASLQEMAVRLGLDGARLLADMESPEIQAILTRNLELGAALDISATPSFVVGTEIISGAIDEAGFAAVLARNARPAPSAVPAKPGL